MHDMLCKVALAWYAWVASQQPNHQVNEFFTSEIIHSIVFAAYLVNASPRLFCHVPKNPISSASKNHTGAHESKHLFTYLIRDVRSPSSGRCRSPASAFPHTPILSPHTPLNPHTHRHVHSRVWGVTWVLLLSIFIMVRDGVSRKIGE
jgi:hypothetical protein